MPDTKLKRTYLFSVGRRKTAVARVRYHAKGQGEITVNDKPYQEYFPTAALQKMVTAPIEHAQGLMKDASITVKVQGGGKQAQAESLRLGISRVLLQVDPELKSTLRTAGFLTRDPRKKERKKPGLKRARRAPQWSKR